MKKLILTSIALSISIMSACTPTPAVNGVNGMMNNGMNNNNTMGGSKLTKTQVLKFMECLVSKSAPNDSKAIKTVADSWANMPDAAFDMALVPQIQYFAKANAALGCAL